MKRATRWHWAIPLAAHLAAPVNAKGWLARTAPGAGSVIERSYETSSESSDGGTSSSRGRTSVFEKVVSVSDGAAIIDYDLEPDADEAERLREWQLPVRLKVEQDGTRSLVNEAALAARLDQWLARAKWTRDVCGKWIFTWNAFYIGCDPQSAIEFSTIYGLRFLEAAEGTVVDDPSAMGTAMLKREGDFLVAMLPVDPAVIATERAEADLVTAQILGGQQNRGSALAARRKETVSGTISLRFRVGADGGVIWRERVLHLTTVKADGVTETDTRKEVTQIVGAENAI